MIIDKEKFKDSFEKAKIRYRETQSVDINLRFSRGLFFTMCTSIGPSFIFNEKRKYVISVNLKRKDLFSKLSEEDLIGWFGHELAHIIEYETMSIFELVLFAFKYLFNSKYRFSVEKRINAFAYNNGFAQELFGVWRKLLSLNNLDIKYKEYITKNYRPEWNDVQQSAESRGISKEFFESFK